LREKLAIIGTGIAGMGTAHFLHKQFDIYLFDKADYVGGHTNTVNVTELGKSVPIDTGFYCLQRSKLSLSHKAIP